MKWSMRVCFLCTYLVLANAFGMGVEPAKPEHVEMVKQVLSLSQIDEIIVRSIRRNLENSNLRTPEETIDVDTYIAFVSKEVVNEKVAPIYARHISSGYATKLISDLQTPMGKLSTKLTRMEIDFGFGEANKEFKKLSPTQRKEFNAYRQSAVYLSLLNAENKVKSEVNEVLQQWLSDAARQRLQQVRIILSDMIQADVKENADISEKALMDSLKRIPKTGVRYVDQEAQISYENLRRSMKLNRYYQIEFRKLSVGDILKPENLISRQGIEDAHLTILSAEGLFDAQTKEFEAINLEYERRLQSILMPAKFKQELLSKNAADMALIFDAQIRQAENIRGLLALQKRVLELCETHLGKISFKGDQLLFTSKEVLDDYNLLIAQIRTAHEAVAQVDNEEDKRRKAVADSLRSPGK